MKSENAEFSDDRAIDEYISLIEAITTAAD
jgi:hypothetical protein